MLLEMDEATGLFRSYSQQALTLAVECVLAVALGNELVGSSPTIGIFPYVAQAVECVLAVALGNELVGSSPTFGIFPYIAQAVEPRASSSLRK